jgi:hypothetical protein
MQTMSLFTGKLTFEVQSDWLVLMKTGYIADYYMNFITDCCIISIHKHRNP